MEAPQRRIRLIPCLVISLIGAGIGALAVTGLFFPLTIWLLGQLPSGNLGIPAELFEYLCPAVVILVVLAPLVVGFALTRSRFTKRRRRSKRADWDAFAGGEENQE